MKILIIAHKLPYPPRGGATLRNYNLLKECSRENEIHLLTFTQEPYLRDPLQRAKSIEGLKKYCKTVKVFDIPTDKSRLAWIFLLFFNIFTSTPYSCWRFYSRKMKNAIKESLLKNRFDLIEIGTVSLLKYARLAPDLPKLLIHHNIESQLLYRRSNTADNLFVRLYLKLQAHKLKRLEKWASVHIDHHTTVSDLDKETITEYCPNIKATTIENGVDTDFFVPETSSEEENSLVYAGSMEWYPNRDAMLYFINKIWPILKHKLADIKMNLIGANPPSELIDFSKREPNFRLHGFVDDVRPYVHNSAVYIVPITVGGGTRLKIVDAMAMGKAIVSTSIGCEGIKVKHGENIIIADNPGDFATSIIELLADRELRLRLGQSARETAIMNYSWKLIAPKLNNIYKELAGTNLRQ